MVKIITLEQTSELVPTNLQLSAESIGDPIQLAAGLNKALTDFFVFALRLVAADYANQERHQVVSTVEQKLDSCMQFLLLIHHLGKVIPTLSQDEQTLIISELKYTAEQIRDYQVFAKANAETPLTWARFQADLVSGLCEIKPRLANSNTLQEVTSYGHMFDTDRAKYPLEVLYRELYTREYASVEDLLERVNGSIELLIAVNNLLINTTLLPGVRADKGLLHIVQPVFCANNMTVAAVNFQSQIDYSISRDLRSGFHAARQALANYL